MPSAFEYGQNAHLSEFAPAVTLTGTIKVGVETDLSFRVSGKIVERMVDVGDHVAPDQALVRLDPQQQEADVASAKGRHAVRSGSAHRDLAQ
jgi:membrane fusion protein, multidrug efflux system